MSQTPPDAEPGPAPGARPPGGDRTGSAEGVHLPDPRGSVESLRLPPLLPRRQSPWLIVEVDGTAASHGALVWALREAARRDGTVVAVGVFDPLDGDAWGSADRLGGSTSQAAHERSEAHVLRGIAETGVHGRCRTAVLTRPVLDALVAAARGADLVFVGARGKTLLRQAVPRPPARRPAREA